MKSRLPGELRRRWDALVESEGGKLGIASCQAFLENKTVNDIFYRGTFNGRPCVVKCSSRAPDSIANEFSVLKRVYADNPRVFPEPFVQWTSPDGRMALLVMENVCGGTAEDPASDILQMADTLRRTGIVHRDISAENLICGADGHLKLIDFQFAIDRNDYRESRFMLDNPKYRFVHFGNCELLGPGAWNDVLGLGLLACLRRFAPRDAATRAKLSSLASDMTFTTSVSSFVRLRLRAYLVSLWIQSIFVCKSSTQWRLYKVSRLLDGSISSAKNYLDPVSFSFCISDNYAQHLAVVIVSLLRNNPSVQFVFHVLHRDMTEKTEAMLRRIALSYPNHRMVFHRVDASVFDAFPIPRTLAHITQEMYYRYILPKVIPDESRTIYSDVDVLCVGGDIRELWEMDLRGMPIAAIRKNTGNDRHYVAHMARMGVPEGSAYFFSGMLVMDLDALRNEGFAEECMAKTAEKADELVFPDMDVINAVMLGRLAEIFLFFVSIAE